MRNMNGGRPIPTPEQAQQGAIIAAENAEDLVEQAGALLAASRPKGAAVSLLVVALEEAVKARTLMAMVQVARNQGSRLGFTEENLRDIIFRGHGIRHAAAFFQSMSPTMLTSMVRGTMPDRPDELAQVQWDIVTGEWLMKANTLKQRGIYTDFKDGAWISPRSITADDVAICVHIVKDFVDETTRQADFHRAGQRPLAPTTQEP